MPYIWFYKSKYTHDLLLLKYKINRQHQKPKSNQVVHPERLCFKDHERKNHNWKE